MKKQTLGIFAALTANIIFGFSFIFSKLALDVTEPFIILSLRFTFAFVLLNLLLLFKKARLNLRGKPKLKIMAMGIAQPLLYFIFELYGLRKVSSALSGVIIALVPVAVMLLSGLFLKERPTPLQRLFTLVSIAGVSLISIISNDGSKSHFIGILLLLGAVICASVFNILSRKEAESFTPFERTYIMFLISTVGFNLLALISLKNGYLTEMSKALSSSVLMISVLYMSVLSSVAAFLLYNYSTTVISVVQTSSFSNIVTVVTVLAGVVILKEKFSLWEYILCGIIISGVWGVNFFVEKNNNHN